MKRKLSLAALLLALFVFTSCSKEQEPATQKKAAETTEQKAAKDDCADVHWSHQPGEDGPENWKNLCDGFADCGGTVQSPIDIVTGKAVKGDKLAAIEFNYGKSKVDIINNGHTVQFNVSGNNTVKLNGKEYKLLQFHYHALSEHTIDGKHFPIEVHFVHKYSDNDFAVLGVMFTEGKANELFKKYLDHFPTTKGEYQSDEMIDLLSLFPENKTYYYYDGSLTTPPCSEVVSWYVLKAPVSASKEQVKQFSSILNNNYRPIQPLNGREVLLFEE